MGIANHSDTAEASLSQPVEEQSGALVSAAVRDTLITRAAVEYIFVLQRTITVPDDYPSILLAVMHSGVGDSILVKTGEYQEHLTITRPLTLSAVGNGVTISSIDPAVPILMVDVSENYEGSVSINGITFVGKYGMLPKSQTAVEIASGRCRLNECTFVDWYQLHASYPAHDLEDDVFDAYMGDYEGGIAVSVAGRSSALEASQCAFQGADVSIEAFDQADVLIRACTFTDHLNAVSLDSVEVSLDSNTFLGTNLCIGRNVRLVSEFDSIDGSEALISTSASSGSALTFNHLSYRGDTLVGVAVGDGLVHPGEHGEWLWEAPDIIFTDSILAVRQRAPTVRYAPSAHDLDTFGLQKSWEAIDVWQAVKERGRNLICVQGAPWSEEARFGPLHNGRLSLLPDSPALFAASDGSHLGAWQGE